MRVHLRCKELNPFTHLLCDFCEVCVLLQQLQKLLALHLRVPLTSLIGHGNRLSMSRICFGCCFVTVGLAGLSQKNQRGRVGRLQTKRQIQ